MFLSHPKSKIVLIISVQSSIVRGTLVKMEKGKIPVVFFSHNHLIKHRTGADDDYLVKSVLKAIKETVNSVVPALHTLNHSGSEFSGKISEIHYVLSAPWIYSRAKTIKQDFAKPTIITRKGVSNIVSRERSVMEAEAGKSETVEEKIFDVRLNGYTVENWEGRTAASLEISFASSIANKEIIKQFREICDNSLYTHTVNFHSSLLLYYVGIKAILPNKDNYILIHIHGELTDVLIIQNRQCVYFGSFPRGIKTIIRSISKSLNVSEELADSFLALYIGNRMESDQEKNAAAVVGEISKDWIGELTSSLKKSTYTGSLPENVMLIARIHEDFFMRSYKSSYPKSDIQSLDRELLAKSVAFESKVEHLRVLALYGIALNILQ